MPASNKKSTKKPAASKAATQKRTAIRTPKDYKLMVEISLITAFAFCVLLFLCNFGIIGPVGNAISGFSFGMLGLFQYIFPIYLFGIIIMALRNIGHNTGKIICSVLLMFFISNILELISGITKTMDEYSIKTIFSFCKEAKKGGGLISGSATYLLVKLFSVWGTVIISIIAALICLIIISEGSLVNRLKDTKEILSQKSLDNKIAREAYIKEQELDRERRNKVKEERLNKSKELKESRDLKKEIKEDTKILRVNKKVSGVTEDTLLISRNTEKSDNNDIHEINVNDFDVYNQTFTENDIHSISTSENNDVPEELFIMDEAEESIPYTQEALIIEEPIVKKPVTQKPKVPSTPQSSNISAKPPVTQAKSTASPGSDNTGYVFPPIELLTENKSKKAGDSADLINSTANKLVETLKMFGVEATVNKEATCQGPTVTRFELIPKPGTKVSRIKSLSDDLKLSLATSDIRIEAPIPGKSAVGIEIPNKTAQSVLLRDLIEDNEFKNKDSSLAFAVGKDISGKVIAYSIDQFPHLLIAGATGSGKSVCINTLIVSLIYKAHPNDVKMIMIDPKVVELSVYNGIPHLLIPVVTDPKKASAALNWAVNEMMERYKKFADLNVRDLKGYNEAVLEREKTEGPSEIFKKLPQIVIIVDELADLMMVAKNDVEDAICRLAQLARACGIHLIIATQRPSVDVITGLIKANMPSRLAFAVSSGIDSRTILDMVGAEELLGKGDMLFFPKGLKKPVRLQGAFVSDSDVNRIVDFLKSNNSSVDEYSSTVMSQIESTAASSSSSQAGSGGAEQAEFDEFFMDAAKYIIKNDKASIGNLQRVFRIGFNRAARIMDKLAEIGVVSTDEGTKARRVLMTMEEFENYIEENNM